MSDAAPEVRAPLTIREQADFLDYLVGRCITLHGTPAEETMMRLSADEADDLGELARRLQRMAPHEAAIKRVVTGK